MVFGATLLLSPRWTLALALLLTGVLWGARGLVPPPEPPVRLQGQIVGLKSSLGGGWVVRLKEGSRVLLSPNLGRLPPLAVGDWLAVSGFSRRWRGVRFILPTSRRHLEVAGPEVTALQEVLDWPEGRPVLLEARVEALEDYTSRAGKRHLRFTVVQDEVRCPAIMWEGTFTAEDRERLGSGQSLRLRATTARYRERPSLVVQGLAP